VSDPLTTTIAVALVSKAVDGLSEGGKAAFAALARLVRRKLGAEALTQTDGALAGTQLSDEDRHHALSVALQQAMAEDPLFAADLVRLWQGAQEGRIADAQPGVLNTVSGDVDGTVVQARDIHGGISFGAL
jgi:hypothetical protein